MRASGERNGPVLRTSGLNTTGRFETALSPLFGHAIASIPLPAQTILRPMRKRRHKQLAKRGRTVSVISWQGVGWGIDIDNGRGRHKGYAVGPREAAEKEAQRIRSGGRARTRVQAHSALKELAAAKGVLRPS
jgi:hypothetical protein